MGVGQTFERTLMVRSYGALYFEALFWCAALLLYCHTILYLFVNNKLISVARELQNVAHSPSGACSAAGSIIIILTNKFDRKKSGAPTMKLSKTLIASALIASAGIAQAEITANVGVVSNYYFRGITQTDDGAAIQGGFDYSNGSGFYAGVWSSNVDFGGKESTEIDLYSGFGSDIGATGISYDVGTIYYAYPGAGGDNGGGDLDYAEIYTTFSYSVLSASLYYNIWGEVESTPANNQVNDEGDYFWNISADVPLPEHFSISAFIARADFDSRADDYTYWGASLARDVGEFGSLSLNYEQNDGGGDNANVIAVDDSSKFWLGWSKGF